MSLLGRRMFNDVENEDGFEIREIEKKRKRLRSNHVNWKTRVEMCFSRAKRKGIV